MYVDISKLVGQTIKSIDIDNEKYVNGKEYSGAEEIIFHTDDTAYKMFHEQDCCEMVDIKQIDGDMNDLIGNPILKAENRRNEAEPENDDSATHTFYELATIKGSVTISWVGESNGYYSEEVNFIEVGK